jgi:hypothetical protein
MDPGTAVRRRALCGATVAVAKQAALCDRVPVTHIATEKGITMAKRQQTMKRAKQKRKAEQRTKAAEKAQRREKKATRKTAR